MHGKKHISTKKNRLNVKVDVSLFATLYGLFLLEKMTRSNYPIHYLQYGIQKSQ